MKPPILLEFNSPSRPKYKWVVWHYDEAGKRIRKLFKTKTAAQEFKDDEEVRFANLGNEHAGLLTKAVMRDAAEAWKLVRPLGVSLLDVAKDYASRSTYREKNVTVSKLVKDFLEEHEKRRSSKIHRRNLKSRLAKFTASFGERQACDVQRAELVKWIRQLGLAKQTVNNVIKELRSCLVWAVEEKIIPANPLEKTKDVREKVVRAPGVITPAEFTRLLAVASPDVMPYFAIGGFAGMRTEELRDLDWQDVRLAESLIVVKAQRSDGEITKGGARRVVTIGPALAAFLAPYAGRTGKVCTPSWRRLFRESLRRAGFGKPGTESKEEKKQGLKIERKWPHNALRHSFGSYHLEHYKDMSATALQMGHTETTTLFKHYKATVTPAAAAAWWAIRPESEEGKVVPMKGAA